MSDGTPLRRETHAHREGPFAMAHLAGLVALGLGGLGFLIVALSQEQMWSQPDFRIAIPFLVATMAAAIVSIVRREGMWALPMVGVGLAGAAMVLGWFVILAAVVLATVVVIVILHAVM